MNAQLLSKLVFSAACSFSLVGLLTAAPQPNTGNIRLITKETRLGKVPLMAVMKGFVISPDCRHIAFGVRQVDVRGCNAYPTYGDPQKTTRDATTFRRLTEMLQRLANPQHEGHDPPNDVRKRMSL